MPGKIPSSLGHGRLTGLIRFELSENGIDGEKMLSKLHLCINGSIRR